MPDTMEQTLDWRILLKSGNPNAYAHLHETPLKHISILVLVASFASIAALLLLLTPTLLQTGESFEQLATETDITLSGSFEQRNAVYFMTNPDVIVTSGPERGFVTITPEGLSIKYFVLFGERTYPWITFADVNAIPLDRFAFAFALFALPSALVWGSFLILANLTVFGLLYTAIAYFVLHARNRTVRYDDLWKVTLLAGVPSMALLALSPVLRLGLPVAIIVGLLFVLWLVFSLLGSTLVAHEEPRANARKRT